MKNVKESMSISIIKLQIPAISDSALTPNAFTNDLLIVLIRELTRVVQGRMPQQEMAEFGIVMREYIRRVVATLGNDKLTCLDSNPNVLYHNLFADLYDYLSDELLSRQISYIVQEKSLSEIFNESLTNELI